MSFNIGLSGLRASQKELSIVGNNIANASTVGFKEARAEFADVFAASVLGGGSNDVGSGVILENVGQSFSQGNITFTDNTLDLAINGEGFFVLNTSTGTAYTRAGRFGTDREGYIVNNTGDFLQGFAPTDDGEIGGGGALVNLRVSTSNIEPRRTSLVDTSVNLDASATPSSIRGSEYTVNSGSTGNPERAVNRATAATLNASYPTGGANFSGTTAATVTGNVNLSAGFDFSIGAPHTFSISVDGNSFNTVTLNADTTGDAVLLDGAITVAHVQAQLDAALGASGLVTAGIDTSGFITLTSATLGNTSGLIIQSVNGSAANAVINNSPAGASGVTAPPSGFALTYDNVTENIILSDNFTDTGPLALALGGGVGSGNEALEDYIQDQINGNTGMLSQVTVSVDALGNLDFTSVATGNHSLTIDPTVIPPGGINFNDPSLADFTLDRRVGTTTVTGTDFTVPNDSSFTLVVDGTLSSPIVLNQDFTDTGPAAILLGGGTGSGNTALEKFIQAAIDADTALPGDVVVSIASNGDFVMHATNPNFNDLQVLSNSTAGVATGSTDVSSGLDFTVTTGPGNGSFDLSIDGGPVATITLTANTSLAGSPTNVTPDGIVTHIQSQIDTSAIGGGAVTAGIDSNGFITLTTNTFGPTSSVEITNASNMQGALANTPVPLAIPEQGGGAPNSFNTVFLFNGDEFTSTGRPLIDNGYGSETITVLDSDGVDQIIELPLGASANEVAALFNRIDGVSANASTTAYLTQSNLGSSQDVPVTFTVNNITVTSSNVDNDVRLQDFADLINAETGSVSASVVQDPQSGNDILQVVESNGLDINFSGGISGNGQGSITIIGSTEDSSGNPIPNPFGVSQQLADLSNTTEEAIVVGGIIDFTLEENVTLTDTPFQTDGTTAIAAVTDSLFGDVRGANDLIGTNFELNLFDPNDPGTFFRSTAVAIYDSLGNQHTLTQYFVRERDAVDDPIGTGSRWSMYVLVDNADVGDPVPNGDGTATRSRFDIVFDENGILDQTRTDIMLISNWVPLGSDGRPNGADGPLNAIDGGSIPIPEPNTASNFVLDLDDSTQFGAAFSVNTNTQDGFTTGRLTGLDVSDNGVVFARYSNGQSEVLGEVTLANFANAKGLSNLGGTKFAETFESGNPTIGTGGTAALGVIKSGALEDSNVDLSEQLVQLIITQRNFQANAQTIEAMDSVTQTIINI